jgi:hypothetical protein
MTQNWRDKVDESEMRYAGYRKLYIVVADLSRSLDGGPYINTIL